MSPIEPQLSGVKLGFNRLVGFGTYLSGAIIISFLGCFSGFSRRLSHTAVVHCGTLLGIAELICATAMTGQCAVYLGSLQIYFLQSACLFGLLGAMEFFGRLNRSAQLMRLPGFGSWLCGCLRNRRRRAVQTWQSLDYQIALSAGSGSSPSAASLDSESQMRVAQLCLLLYLMLLLWLCIKGIIFISIVVNNNEPRVPEKEACANVLASLPPMIVISAIGRSIIFICALLPF